MGEKFFLSDLGRVRDVADDLPEPCNPVPGHTFQPACKVEFQQYHGDGSGIAAGVADHGVDVGRAIVEGV